LNDKRETCETELVQMELQLDLEKDKADCKSDKKKNGKMKNDTYNKEDKQIGQVRSSSSLIIRVHTLELQQLNNTYGFDYIYSSAIVLYVY